MYDPTIGRWISQDPLGFEAGDANLYRYVGNSPTNATDPSGLQINPGVTFPNTPQWNYNQQQMLNPPRPSRPRPVAPPFPAAGAAAIVPANTPGTWLQNFTLFGTPSRPAMANAHQFAQGAAPTPLTPAQIAAAIALQPPDKQAIPTCRGGTHQLFPATLAPGQLVGTNGCAGSIGLIIHSPGHGTAVFHFGNTNGAPQTINQYIWPAGSHAIICGGDNGGTSNVQMNQVIGALAQNGITLDGILNTGNCYLGADGNWYVDTRPAFHDPR
jgi:uncharacterized protein RhaS with RHS repeats